MAKKIMSLKFSGKKPARRRGRASKNDAASTLAQGISLVGEVKELAAEAAEMRKASAAISSAAGKDIKSIQSDMNAAVKSMESVNAGIVQLSKDEAKRYKDESKKTGEHRRKVSANLTAMREHIKKGSAELSKNLKDGAQGIQNAVKTSTEEVVSGISTLGSTITTASETRDAAIGGAVKSLKAKMTSVDLSNKNRHTELIGAISASDAAHANAVKGMKGHITKTANSMANTITAANQATVAELSNGKEAIEKALRDGGKANRAKLTEFKNTYVKTANETNNLISNATQGLSDVNASIQANGAATADGLAKIGKQIKQRSDKLRTEISPKIDAIGGSAATVAKNSIDILDRIDKSSAKANEYYASVEKRGNTIAKHLVDRNKQAATYHEESQVSRAKVVTAVTQSTKSRAAEFSKHGKFMADTMTTIALSAAAQADARSSATNTRLDVMASLIGGGGGKYKNVLEGLEGIGASSSHHTQRVEDLFNAYTITTGGRHNAIMDFLDKRRSATDKYYADVVGALGGLYSSSTSNSALLGAGFSTLGKTGNDIVDAIKTDLVNTMNAGFTGVAANPDKIIQYLSEDALSKRTTLKNQARVFSSISPGGTMAPGYGTAEEAIKQLESNLNAHGTKLPSDVKKAYRDTLGGLSAALHADHSDITAIWKDIDKISASMTHQIQTAGKANAIAAANTITKAQGVSASMTNAAIAASTVNSSVVANTVSQLVPTPQDMGALVSGNATKRGGGRKAKAKKKAENQISLPQRSAEGVGHPSHPLRNDRLFTGEYRTDMVFRSSFEQLKYIKRALHSREIVDNAIYSPDELKNRKDIVDSFDKFIMMHQSRNPTVAAAEVGQSINALYKDLNGRINRGMSAQERMLAPQMIGNEITNVPAMRSELNKMLGTIADPAYRKQVETAMTEFNRELSKGPNKFAERGIRKLYADHKARQARLNGSSISAVGGSHKLETVQDKIARISGVLDAGNLFDQNKMNDYKDLLSSVSGGALSGDKNAISKVNEIDKIISKRSVEYQKAHTRSAYRRLGMGGKHLSIGTIDDRLNAYFDTLNRSIVPDRAHFADEINNILPDIRRGDPAAIKIFNAKEKELRADLAARARISRDTVYENTIPFTRNITGEKVYREGIIKMLRDDLTSNNIPEEFREYVKSTLDDSDKIFGKGSGKRLASILNEVDAYKHHQSMYESPTWDLLGGTRSLKLDGSVGSVRSIEKEIQRAEYLSKSAGRYEHDKGQFEYMRRVAQLGTEKEKTLMLKQLERNTRENLGYVPIGEFGPLAKRAAMGDKRMQRAIRKERDDIMLRSRNRRYARWANQKELARESLSVGFGGLGKVLPRLLFGLPGLGIAAIRGRLNGKYDETMADAKYKLSPMNALRESASGFGSLFSTIGNMFKFNKANMLGGFMRGVAGAIKGLASLGATLVKFSGIASAVSFGLAAKMTRTGMASADKRTSLMNKYNITIPTAWKNGGDYGAFEARAFDTARLLRTDSSAYQSAILDMAMAVGGTRDEMGKPIITSLSQVERMNKNLTMMAKATGTSEMQLQAILMQLYQGIGKGKLDTQDIKPMLNQSPAFADMLAKRVFDLPGGRSQLFSAMDEGAGDRSKGLTGAMLIKGLLRESLSSDMDEYLRKSARSFEEMFTIIKSDMRRTFLPITQAFQEFSGGNGGTSLLDLTNELATGATVDGKQLGVAIMDALRETLKVDSMTQLVEGLIHAGGGLLTVVGKLAPVFVSTMRTIVGIVSWAAEKFGINNAPEETPFSFDTGKYTYTEGLIPGSLSGNPNKFLSGPRMMIPMQKSADGTYTYPGGDETSRAVVDAYNKHKAAYRAKLDEHNKLFGNKLDDKEWNTMLNFAESIANTTGAVGGVLGRVDLSGAKPVTGDAMGGVLDVSAPGATTVDQIEQNTRKTAKNTAKVGDIQLALLKQISGQYAINRVTRVQPNIVANVGTIKSGVEYEQFMNDLYNTVSAASVLAY